VVEGAGAVGVAALLAGRGGGSGPAVAVLSGGNIDPTMLISVVRHGLTVGGRYLVVRTELADRPGELIKLLSLVAEERGTVSADDGFSDHLVRRSLLVLGAVLPYEPVGDVAAARNDAVVALVQLPDVDYLHRVLGPQALELVHLDGAQGLGLGPVQQVAAKAAETDCAQAPCRVVGLLARSRQDQWALVLEEDERC